MSRYDIAIIGMGCNFPRAETVEKYWRNIKSGDSFFTKMPKRLWRLDNFYSKNRVKREKSYTTIGAFIDAFEFPFRKYRLPPNTMKGMDPAQLVSIQATEQALADAGIEPRSEALDDAVTIIGASGVDGFAHTSTFLRRHRFFDHLRPKLERSGAPASLIARLEEEFNQELQERGHTWDPANAAVGNVPSSISNRVAQVFGIRGFNMTVDAACASSMVALDVACQALCAGDTRLAVAGGCDLGTNPGIYVGFSQMEGLSISGHSNPFDHTADGLVIGEGVGVMVLKRLEDALSDGDQVRAVIRGVGASSDGAGQAIYAPSVKGRVKSFKTALDNARTHPSEVQYLEAHATSTIVGDAVEYDAISETYGHDRQGNAPLLIGSVKQQIGHLKAAAGMAGLIKTVLAMENGAFPHMPRFSKLTPEAQNPTANIQVPTRVMRWEPHANGLRVAAVTASGFGGVNYHAILEQGDQYQPPPERKTVPRDIAVVAMVCRLPGADTVDGFWDNVTHERDKFWPVDARKIGWHDHLDAGPENERITTRVIGKLDDWDFNFLKHKIFPKSISQIAATQFLALDLGERLLAQGGLDLASPKSIGVSVGTMHDDYYPTLCSPMFDQEYSDAIRCCPSAPQLDAERLDQALLAAAEQFKSEDPPITEHTLPGWMTNVTAGRMANKLNLHGPNFTVDSACSSGLAALLPAMYQLMFGNVDMMISGGLNRQLSAEFTVGVCTLGAVAEEIPRPFDERGQGFLIGEGGVQYLLKRLSDAQRDGDEIIAVLRSVHGSSEADSKSMVAPSEPAVRRAIRNALARTPVQPQDIRVVDVHGSANPVSDIVEARSLAAELRADGPGPGPVHITAIKSHVGHLYGGSGASSMLSTIMALRSGMAPGIRNLERLRPELQDIDDRAQPRKGSRSINGAKAGGVNSLGLGGANYFAVLSLPEANAQATSESSQTPEAEIPMPQPNPTGPQPVAEATGGHAAGIFLCSADGPQQLLASLRRALQQSPMASVIRAGGTGSLRLAASYQDKPELKRRVEAVVRMLDGGHDLSPLESQGVFVAERLPGEAPRKLAFCFPGQGVHYISMGRHLYDSNAVFRDAVDQVDALAREAFGFDLLAHIYGPEGDPGIEQALGTLVGAQTSLFAIEVGLARMLESMGVAPDVMIGHSFGEISALTAAGVWDLQTAYKVVEERIRAARAINTGGGPALGMMSLICAEAQRDSLLALAGGAVLLTNVNAPGRYVLAGELQAVKRTVEGAQAFGADATLLPIGGAFHSRYMEPAREPFRRALEGLPCSPPRYSILSTVTGEHIDATSVTSSWLAEHLSKQFVTPIDLVRDVGRLHREGVRHFLEVGPRWAMTKMVGGVLEGKQFRAAYCLHPKVGDEETFRRAKAFLMALGHLDPDGQHEAPQQDGRGRAFASLLSPSFLGYLGSSEPAVVALLKEAYLRFEQSGTPELPSEPPPAPPAPVRPPPAPVVAASPAAAPVPPQPEPAAPTPAAPSAAPEDLSVWIARLRQKLVDITGYPADMLEEQLDLEADLGVDSVQRAEIWTSLLNEHGLDASARPSGSRTIANLAENLLRMTSASPPEIPAAAPQAAPATTPAAPEPPPAAPEPPPATPIQPAPSAPATDELSVWVERLRQKLVDITGYPADMLEEQLDLEADLGVDSVQRAEIWTSLTNEHGLDASARPSGPRTIANLAQNLLRMTGASPAQAPATAAPPAAPATPAPGQPAAPAPAADELSVWVERLRQKLVDITGYPADMLEEQLDLEADLGVDSVQRAEIWTSLLNEHGLDATSRPSGPRTIANLAQALLELVPTEPAPPSSEPVAPPIPAPPPPPPDPADLVEPEGLAASPTIVPLAELAEATPQDAWEERLRHSLAEATGYPQEMLESHLDLEADLGIDSVQRAEIWSSLLAERGLDPKARPSGPRTIRNLALCLAQLSEGDDPGPAPERAPTPEPAPPPEPTPTPRPDPVDELRSEPAVALEQALPTEDQAPTGEACALMVSASATLPKRDLAPFACRSVLAITAELGNCPVAKRLRGCGVDVLSLRASSVASMGEEELEQAMQGRDTLLYLAHRRLAALKPDGESLSAALSEQTRLLYGAFRALWPLLQRKGLRIMVPVSQDGAFGASLRTPAGLLGSFPAGFVRCLRHELPDCVIQLIDAGEIPWEDAVERRLDTVSDELEVGRSSFRDLRATLAPLGATSVRPDVLTPGDLVLVTGGARGIVFECVLALAKITGVRLLLTGRTALPQDRPDWLSASPATVDATIRALEIDLVRNRGMGLGEAKRVGARARSQWELTRNLQRLAAAGVEARYEVCDVSDTASFSTLLGRIAQADTVRGVVHGAGIQRSHLLDELDDETVDLTIRTKLAPFFAMLDSLDWSQLRLFSAFGSIAGLFGNAGQTDYALANDQLCWAVRWLRQRYPHLRAQTIEWTAWTGTGMVSAEESKRFAEAGLTPLTVRAGVKLFLEGLLGSDHTQLAAFNPSAAFAGGRPMARFPVAAQPLKRLVEFPEGRSPSVRLDLSRDLYLEQHLVQGQPVAPGTFVANIFAEVAQRDGETVRDVRFRRPLSVRQAGLDLEVLRLGDQLALLPGERPALDDKAILNLAYSTCRVVPQEELTPPPLSFTARDLLALHGAAQDAETPFYELLDREFRHALDTGPIFRGIRSTRHQDECFLSLVSLGDEAAALLAIPGEFVFNPVLADMAVQTGCAWAMITHRVMAIPWELGGVEVHGETQDREAVVICRAIQLSPKQSVLDITVREPDGRPVFQLDRLVLKTIAEQGVGPDDET